VLFPTQSQDLPPEILFCLGPTKMPTTGKGLGVMTRLLKKQRYGCKYRIETGTKRVQMLLFLAGARLKVLIKIM
jgi:hypothetical protein